MRPQTDMQNIRSLEIGVRPKISHFSRWCRELQIFPAQTYICGFVPEIENSKVPFLRMRLVRDPDADIALLQQLMATRAVLVHIEHLFVRDERRCSSIIARQIAAKDQRRSEDTPPPQPPLVLVGG